MGPILAVAASLTLGIFLAPVFASEARITSWDDLAPRAEQYDNPFAKLTSEQLRDLRKLLRQKQTGDVPSKEVSALRSRLENDGLNVDWLFSQRKLILQKRQQLLTKTNDQLVGTKVRIPGYLLPLEFAGVKTVEFLLVPTVGACIHTPPPPPNQLVHVRYPSGFFVKQLYSPVWITGRLEAETRSPSVDFVDGRTQITVGYFMNAVSVEPYIR